MKLLECESVRSGTPVKLDDVSGYGTADSCSDKTPPYLPTNRLTQQQPFETISRDDIRKDLSMGCRSERVSIVYIFDNLQLVFRIFIYIELEYF